MNLHLDREAFTELVTAASHGEYPKVCVNLQTDVR